MQKALVGHSAGPPNENVEARVFPPEEAGAVELVAVLELLLLLQAPAMRATATRPARPTMAARLGRVVSGCMGSFLQLVVGGGAGSALLTERSGDDRVLQGRERGLGGEGEDDDEQGAAHDLDAVVDLEAGRDELAQPA